MTLSPLALPFLQLVFLIVSLAPDSSTVRVSSFLRTREQNDSVGGRPNSFHLVGLAIDLVGAATALSWILRLWQVLGFDGVDEGDHVHLELDGPALRP